jgi:hypothetical protein
MAPPRIADGPNLAGNDLAKTKTAKPPEYCGVFGSYRALVRGQRRGFIRISDGRDPATSSDKFFARTQPSPWRAPGGVCADCLDNDGGAHA